MSFSERIGLRRFSTRRSSDSNPMVINAGQVRSGSIVPHLGSIVHPTATVVFRFAVGERSLELPVSSRELFENGVMATARKTFPRLRGFDVRLDTRPMSVIISRPPDGLPSNSIETYIRALSPDLANAAQRYLRG